MAPVRKGRASKKLGHPFDWHSPDRPRDVVSDPIAAESYPIIIERNFF
jgi:hypothetical protein